MRLRLLGLSALLLQGCFYIGESDYRARWDLDGDGVERPADCDDADGALQTRTWFVDADGDGFGGADTVEACEQPDGFVANDDDCDDASSALHPDAAELCNGQDDDCDLAIDDDITFTTWYADADTDGYGDPSAPVDACAPPDDHVQNAEDCDDAASAVNPGAAESCNGIDDDCDETIDDGVTEGFSPDADGDGHGDAYGSLVFACEPPADHGPPDDCNDADDTIHPGADEYCDAIDNDCNGATDDDAVDAPTWFEDCDDDGYGDPNAPKVQCSSGVLLGACPLVGPYPLPAYDCDDADCNVHPAALETCNGADDDCDLVIDNACDTAAVADTACPTGP